MSFSNTCASFECFYRFRQAALVHVFIAGAPLPASAGVVHGPWGAGHPVTVVAGVGRVVNAVSVVVVMVVAVRERKSAHMDLRSKRYYPF